MCNPPSRTRSFLHRRTGLWWSLNCAGILSDFWCYVVWKNGERWFSESYASESANICLIITRRTRVWDSITGREPSALTIYKNHPGKGFRDDVIREIENFYAILSDTHQFLWKKSPSTSAAKFIPSHKIYPFPSPRGCDRELTYVMVATTKLF